MVSQIKVSVRDITIVIVQTIQGKAKQRHDYVLSHAPSPCPALDFDGLSDLPLLFHCQLLLLLFML
jgi:hypothetical protein